MTTATKVELQWGPGRMPGKTGKVVQGLSARRELQWGPGRMPGKTHQVADGFALHHALQWGPGRMPGKTSLTFQYPFDYERFNGAPAGCRGRRKTDREHKFSILASMGPRQDAGEDKDYKTDLTPQDIASMGPRQDAGEDMFPKVGPTVRILSFNGAPAGCRGRL